MMESHRPRAVAGYLPLLSTATACSLLFWWLVWFNFPAPFTDEAWFTAPGLAFAEHGNFQTPLLHPDRALHWMPVGYFVLSGLFVKLSGVPGLFGFRLFSTVVSAANLLLAALLSARRTVLQKVVLLAPFVSMPLLTMSRLARMESLVILAFLACTLAAARRRDATALALALSSCAVHPNGAFAVLAACACIGVRLAYEGPGPVIAGFRRDWWQVAIAVGLVIGYAGYEGLHWVDYQHDMAFQMQRKHGNWHFWQKTTVFALLTIPSACIWIARRRRPDAFVPCLFGSGLMLTRVAGQEVWYTTLFLVGVALLAVAVLDTVAWPQAGSRTAFRRWSVGAGCAAICAIFVLSCTVVGWNGDRIALHPPADREDDRRAGRAIVADVEAAPWFGRSSISCLPWYECLLLMEDDRHVVLPLRMPTPITAMPIGEHCVTIRRQRGDDQWSLQRGPVIAHAIAPCPADWPRSTH